MPWDSPNKQTNRQTESLQKTHTQNLHVDIDRERERFLDVSVIFFQGYYEICHISASASSNSAIHELDRSPPERVPIPYQPHEKKWLMSMTIIISLRMFRNEKASDDVK